MDDNKKKKLHFRFITLIFDITLYSKEINLELNDGIKNASFSIKIRPIQELNEVYDKKAIVSNKDHKGIPFINIVDVHSLEITMVIDITKAAIKFAIQKIEAMVDNLKSVEAKIYLMRKNKK